MTVTIQRHIPVIICTGCGDRFEFRDNQALKTHTQGRPEEFGGYAVEGRLSDYVGDECSDCFAPFRLDSMIETVTPREERTMISLDKTEQSVSVGKMRAAINRGLRRNNLLALSLDFSERAYDLSVKTFELHKAEVLAR
ncbi:hypothetical protein [Streptomyces sp. NPDC055793]